MHEEIVQGTDAWKQLRCGRATGSNFDACLAKGKGNAEATGRRNYRIRLALERLTGKVQESGFKSAAMQHGTETEPLARMMYEAATGYIVEEVPFIQHKFLMAGVSPDGLIGSDGMVEFKCPTPAIHWEYLQLNGGEVPSEYWAQTTGQMWCSGRQWVDFVSYCPEFPPELQLHIVRYQRNESVIAEFDAGISKFLRDVDMTVAEVKALAAARGVANGTTV